MSEAGILTCVEMLNSKMAVVGGGGAAGEGADRSFPPALPKLAWLPGWGLREGRVMSVVRNADGGSSCFIQAEFRNY